MAAYPTYGQTTQSRESREDGTQWERASNGALRGRAMWPSDKLTLRIDHLVERADADALLAFYRTNRLSAVDVVWAGDGQTYAMYFASPPEMQPAGGTVWRVTSDLTEA
ncbi:hypothetical protein [Thauera propionica]|uniref:hypothetical protein n=1 Tax=Thauera propionica TaxID=2019431 RepID=UPI0023F510EB|nr:hypothetical protein [Thauera propionica]MDD3675881.1 hypothetical protein [Thauera propionica]